MSIRRVLLITIELMKIYYYVAIQIQIIKIHRTVLKFYEKNVQSSPVKKIGFSYAIYRYMTCINISYRNLSRLCLGNRKI